MTDYEIAEVYFRKNNYIEAFEIFEHITQNPLASDNEKSDAFNMMGAIVLFETNIDTLDESGLNYFLKSLNYNAHNIGALFNIIEIFGKSINNHQNIDAFDNAVKVLKEINYNFSTAEKSMLNKKFELKQELLKNKDT